jgi:hypothetical protein
MMIVMHEWVNVFVKNLRNISRIAISKQTISLTASSV